jgi:carbon-monoxide dehydrogenase large subunit
MAVTGKATGKPVRRVEDPRFLEGAATYVEDVTPADLLHLAFVRSSYPSARLRSIDVEDARQAAGVVAVATSNDVREVGDVPCIPLPFAKVPSFPVLAREHVAAVGQPIVAIVAATQAAARDAADLVQIDFDPQPAVSSAEKALAPNAPRVHAELDSNLCYTLAKEGGEVDQAFAAAEVRIQLRVDSPRVAPIPLEPRGVVAEPQSGQGPLKLKVWVSSQAPHGVRADLAKALGLQPNEIRVISPDVGGGFGAKSGATPEYILACWFALQLGKPVKWVATRGEDLQVTTQGRDMLIYVELAARRDGTITGLKMRNIANMGAFLHSATAIPPTFIMSMAAARKLGRIHPHAVHRPVPRCRPARIRAGDRTRH